MLSLGIIPCFLFVCLLPIFMCIKRRIYSQKWYQKMVNSQKRVERFYNPQRMQDTYDDVTCSSFSLISVKYLYVPYYKIHQEEKNED
ncbi:MAG: hypothetical protein AYK18_01575 [Theionarchaea archaeon DG-70]|nr:MAG: hypothetical protein AYK18_01575 [Theionarchaea archaeon DG-70]